MSQAKLVRVIQGAVFDVVVDIRKGSPAYGKWFGVTLSKDNFKQLFVPKGFAHGYLTLEPETEFIYKVDEVYAPDKDSGLRWDDPDIAIEWPFAGLGDPILSDKDKALPSFASFDSPFVYQAK